MGYRVIGEFAAVTIGEPDGNGVVQILERGAVVPDGVHQNILDHLVTVGQIEDQAGEPEDQAGEQSDGGNTGSQGDGELAESEPGLVLTELDLNALRALAAERGVDLQGATRKVDIIAALEAAE